MAGRQAAERVRLVVRVDRATYDQLQELSQVLHVRQSAVVAQAVARLHSSEPLIRNIHKQVKNGDGSSVL